MSDSEAMDASKLTPMMRQFFELKERAKDAVLFFRMGDFYEIFGDDALEVAPKLELVLTSRERGDKQKIPFCGVPHHSAKNYWIKLLKLGYRVALADQLEAPDASKGIVRRDIVRVFTPGCIDELEGLDSDRPNYLMAVYEEPASRRWFLAVVDVSTGEFRLGFCQSSAELSRYIAYFRPKELLARQFILDRLKQDLSYILEQEQVVLGVLAESNLRNKKLSLDLVERVFASTSFEGKSWASMPGSLELIGAVLAHLESLSVSLDTFLSVGELMPSQVMRLDETAIRDLELFETSRRRDFKGSLLRAINFSKTPMGSRLLRANLAAPFVSYEPICKRQDAIELLCEKFQVLDALHRKLNACPDLERLAGRCVSSKASPQEVSALREVLATVLSIKDEFAPSLYQSDSFVPIFNAFSKSLEPLELLNEALNEEPGFLSKNLDVIKEGFDPSFDALRKLAVSGQSAILAYEKSLREQTGISSLKIKTHKTFGLQIEVTKANLNRVPEYFVRRQTMVNNERFVTEELIDLHESLSSATDEALEAEQVIFFALLDRLKSFFPFFKEIAAALAELDVIQGLAWLARNYRYTRPVLEEKRKVEIRSGRHPVLEQSLGSTKFTANDLLLDDPISHLLITGPNMAGKSTIMRQTALIAILHQIGSFVPASSARLPIFDRIFTRVGAADDLSRGQSTFMVEMSEAAHILREASPRSLVILDEVGRGTSSEDGLAIAAAILENLACELGCFSLFATHYHELAELADSLESVAKVQTQVIEEAGSIRFTHRLVEGASASSFGLEVARLAGIPAKVLSSAEKKLAKSWQQAPREDGPKQQESDIFGVSMQGRQTHSSSFEGLIELESKLKRLKIDRMTPLQALNLLNEYKMLVTNIEQPPLFSDFHN